MSTTNHTKSGQTPDDTLGQKPDEKPEAGRSITFTIDGVEHTTDDRPQKVADLLWLAGVDPKDHDLGLVGPEGTVKKLPDDDDVRIKSGDRFVTIYDGATPVV